MNPQIHSKKLQLAIATTIADAEDSIEQFIEYHLKIGFSRIYIFIDDNNEATENLIKSHPNVVYYMRDEQLLARWQPHMQSIGREKCSLLSKEAMIRQELNFYIAHEDAQKEHIDWLLHIDIDELFFPNENDLQQHFSELQIQGVGGITYLNYESISTQMDSPSIYLSSKYFKINFFRYKHWIFNKEQLHFIKSNPWLGEKFFKFYQNGKSCIRIYKGKVYFADVHSIWGEGHRRFATSRDPVVLHFPCARYSDFIKKYTRLGSFPDNWLGHKRAGDYIDEAHLNSRDALLLRDEQGLCDFYRDNFTLNKNEIDKLIENKMAIEIDFHFNLISRD